MDRRHFLSLLPLGFAACTLDVLPPDAARIPDVPYVDSEQDIVDAMLRLGEVRANDVVYDLGCGDGRIVIAAAKQYGARGVGIDLDPQLIAVARGYAEIARVSDKTLFKVGDLFDTDLSPASVVTLFLSVDVNKRLQPKLLRELKPGSRVVSNRFDMGDIWKPERTIMLGSRPIFLWRIPA